MEFNQYAVKNYGKNAVRLARNAVSKTSCPIWKKYRSAKNGKKQVVLVIVEDIMNGIIHIKKLKFITAKENI
ncbi:TPA: hypothetical protein ACSTOR_000979 [Staphylococcus aureus]